MSLKLYSKFEKTLSENGFENVFTVKESLVIAEDLAIAENAPQRILSELNESYGDKAQEFVKVVKEAFKDDFKDGEQDVDEAMRPKKLTGTAKKARDEKAKLMSLVNKDPEIKALKERAKKMIIKKAKALGKKHGIKIQRVNFEKIKL